MTDQTVSADKLRALLDHWERFTRDELHHVSAAEVLTELRYLLPDPPLPDRLFGAWATHPEYGEGIVISHFPDEDGDVRLMFRGDETYDGTWAQWVSPSTLAFHTPDMSKNEAEIDISTAHVDGIDTRPDHPEYLETEDDYRNAPEGTIVALDERKPVVLIDEMWSRTDTLISDHGDMAGARRRVLRWGWGV